MCTGTGITLVDGGYYRSWCVVMSSKTVIRAYVLEKYNRGTLFLDVKLEKKNVQAYSQKEKASFVDPSTNDPNHRVSQSGNHPIDMRENWYDLVVLPGKGGYILHLLFIGEQPLNNWLTSQMHVGNAQCFGQLVKASIGTKSFCYLIINSDFYMLHFQGALSCSCLV